MRNGDKCAVCAEEDGKKKEDKRKRKKGENEADRARGRNVVAVCQLLIRALVCPLWVRGRD